MGSLRESFFVNQASMIQPVVYAEEGDFYIGKYIFEVGGRTKTTRQVRHLENAYAVADDIEIGHPEEDTSLVVWVFLLGDVPTIR